MFGINKNNSNEETSVPKNGAVKNKEIIAEYDEVLNKNNPESDTYLSKLELLKNKLGLGNNFSSNLGIKTNLIDNDDVATFVDWKEGISIFVTYFIVLMIIISGALAYLSFLEKEKKRAIGIYDENILETKENITKEEILVEDGLNFQSKMIAVEALLNKHTYWTNLFEYLEKNSLNNVYFLEFSGGLDGEYLLSAVAKDSYFTASKQIKSFREDDFTESVDVSSFDKAEKEGEFTIDFSLDLTVKPEIFYKQK